jgi:hypothetical protein
VSLPLPLARRALASLDKRAWPPHATRANLFAGKISMKAILSGLLALGLLAVQISEADAAACAAGRYHAGCVGPRGAVVTGHRPYGYHGAAVVRPAYGARCFWRGGVRVCR